MGQGCIISIRGLAFYGGGVRYIGSWRPVADQYAVAYRLNSCTELPVKQFFAIKKEAASESYFPTSIKQKRTASESCFLITQFYQS